MKIEDLEKNDQLDSKLNKKFLSVSFDQFNLQSNLYLHKLIVNFLIFKYIESEFKI